MHGRATPGSPDGAVPQLDAASNPHGFMSIAVSSPYASGARVSDTSDQRFSRCHSSTNTQVVGARGVVPIPERLGSTERIIAEHVRVQSMNAKPAELGPSSIFCPMWVERVSPAARWQSSHGRLAASSRPTTEVRERHLFRRGAATIIRTVRRDSEYDLRDHLGMRS